MRLDHRKVVDLAKAHGESLAAMLDRAGVSRTAYYSLVRRENLLPRTVRALATAAGVREVDLLAPPTGPAATDPRLRRAQEICARFPGADFQHVWQTLTLLERSPLERLRGSLRRGRA